MTDAGSSNPENAPRLRKPWFVAVWPGMGNVAISAGYYLMSKLRMHQIAEFSPEEIFDLESIEIREGLVRLDQRPRSRIFAWIDPQGRRDIVVFIGEAQPDSGKAKFCKRLIDYARAIGVERVFTFAALATETTAVDRSRVFGVAAELEGLAELKAHEVTILEDGHVTGLNGVLLGVAAQNGFRATGLLGEISHLLMAVASPAATLETLRVFTRLAHIDLDFSELERYAEEFGRKFSAAVDEKDAGEVGEIGETEQDSPDADHSRLEDLFRLATEDRTKAYELKAELDRLGLFSQYEDRFLDLFKSSE